MNVWVDTIPRGDMSHLLVFFVPKRKKEKTLNMPDFGYFVIWETVCLSSKSAYMMHFKLNITIFLISIMKKCQGQKDDKEN